MNNQKNYACYYYFTFSFYVYIVKVNTKINIQTFCWAKILARPHYFSTKTDFVA